MHPFLLGEHFNSYDGQVKAGDGHVPLLDRLGGSGSHISQF
jgi:hypothetical protein